MRAPLQPPASPREPHPHRRHRVKGTLPLQPLVRPSGRHCESRTRESSLQLQLSKFCPRVLSIGRDRAGGQFRKPWECCCRGTCPMECAETHPAQCRAWHPVDPE